MPEQLQDDYPFPNIGGSNRYDWDLLLNGKTWRCRPGVDFFTKGKTFANYAYQVAKQRNLLVSVVNEPDGCVVLQARPSRNRTPLTVVPRRITDPERLEATRANLTWARDRHNARRRAHQQGETAEQVQRIEESMEVAPSRREISVRRPLTSYQRSTTETTRSRSAEAEFFAEQDERATAAILEALKADERAQAELYRLAPLQGFDQATIGRALGRLAAIGTVTRSGQGVKGSPYHWRLSHAPLSRPAGRTTREPESEPVLIARLAEDAERGRPLPGAERIA
jgi:hypothetical protein